MREILFRGQQRRKGEKVRLDGTPVESKWVYGGYCQYNEERGIIYQSEPEIDKYSVYADTVGQYTGLTDCNGVKIFEGDIIKGKSGVVYAVEYSQNIAGYISKGFGVLSRPCMNVGSMKYYEVVGNIYDNPELLRKE